MRERIGPREPTTTPAVVPHLTYFAARGRAEVIRLLLEETATPYTERRIDGESWPAAKWHFMLGQLPVYEEGGQLLSGADVICHYLARKHKLYGDGVFEHGRCDMVQRMLIHAQAGLFELYWNPAFDRLRRAYEQQELPSLLTRLQGLYLDNHADSGYWVGDRLSVADLSAWYFLDSVRPLAPPVLSRLDHLCRFKQRIENRPRITAYLRSGRRPAILTAPGSPFGGTPETS